MCLITSCDSSSSWKSFKSAMSCGVFDGRASFEELPKLRPLDSTSAPCHVEERCRSTELAIPEAIELMLVVRRRSLFCFLRNGSKEPSVTDLLLTAVEALIVSNSELSTVLQEKLKNKLLAFMSWRANPCLVNTVCFCSAFWSQLYLSYRWCEHLVEFNYVRSTVRGCQQPRYFMEPLWIDMKNYRHTLYNRITIIPPTLLRYSWSWSTTRNLRVENYSCTVTDIRSPIFIFGWIFRTDQCPWLNSSKEKTFTWLRSRIHQSDVRINNSKASCFLLTSPYFHLPHSCFPKVASSTKTVSGLHAVTVERPETIAIEFM